MRQWTETRFCMLGKGCKYTYRQVPPTWRRRFHLSRSRGPSEGFVIFGLIFVNSIIPAFGGRGTLFEPAKIYYTIVLYGVPILGYCMMGNNVIRAVGKPKNSMYAMMLPSISNLILDYILIYIFDFGMYGAAWATTLSYAVCAYYILFFFNSKQSELSLRISDFNLDLGLWTLKILYICDFFSEFLYFKLILFWSE